MHALEEMNPSHSLLCKQLERTPATPTLSYSLSLTLSLSLSLNSAQICSISLTVLIYIAVKAFKSFYHKSVYDVHTYRKSVG